MKFPKTLVFSVDADDAQTYIGSFEKRGIHVAKRKVKSAQYQTLEIWILDKAAEARITKIRTTLNKWHQRKFMRQFMKTQDWFFFVRG